MPSPANAFSLFAGEWASNVPGFGGGTAELFDDWRLIEIIDLAGGLDGKTCLELGPLEGGHTYLMHRRGAASILSIEANQRAFLKCLITQNALGYDADFLLGDFTKFVATTERRFDFTNMSGVLYHMVEPHELIRHVCRISDQIGCWTHYFDAEVMRGDPVLARKSEFVPTAVTFSGERLELYKQRYLGALARSGFCGGKEEFSYWLTREDIVKAFRACGFEVTILDVTVDHPNGPCMNFFASRA